MAPTRHHAERVFAVASDSSAAARSAIAASWVRSLTDYGLDPETPRRPRRLEQARLDEARDRFALMLQAAEPALDRLFAAVGDAGCCVLLTDHGPQPRDPASQDESARIARNRLIRREVSHICDTSTNDVPRGA